MAIVKQNLDLVSRTDVERLAKIVGADSAAARALSEADRYDGQVRFWLGRYKRQYSVLVEKIPVGTDFS